MIPQISMNDGRSIPQLGFGTWLLRDEAAYYCTLAALKLGYRHLDTAAIYRNEEQVGAAIRDSGVNRDDIFVTTKLWNDRHLGAPTALAESLDRLGLSYVNLYLIHWPVAGRTDYLAAWREFETFVTDGRVHSIGVSNFMPSHLHTLMESATITPAINQIEIHPTFNQAEVAKVNQSLGIVTESWSPLGRATEFEIPQIVSISQRHQRTPAQIILRWHIQHGYVIFPKTTSPERMAENMDIFDFVLTHDDMATLDTLHRDNRIGPDPDTYAFPSTG